MRNNQLPTILGDLEARRLNDGTRRNSFREIVLVAPTRARTVCASVIIKAQIEIVSAADFPRVR